MKYAKREARTLSRKMMVGLRWSSALLVVLTISALASGWGAIASAAPAVGHVASAVGGHTILPGAGIREEGTVTSILGDVWNIGDFTVRVDFYTRIDGNPTIGSRVGVEGWVLMDGTVLAMRIRNLADPSGQSSSSG